jgi:hypothetical protein
MSCGPSAERHLQAIDRYMQAGYDHIILVQIGPNQDGFIEFFERELASSLRKGSLRGDVAMSLQTAAEPIIRPQC